MKLIVGLGNPGEQYIWTRHNIGFLVLEKMAKDIGIKFKLNRRFKSLTSEGRIEDNNIYLAMPQTFMNLSGNAVRSILNWLKIEFSEILVVTDDIAIPFGELRLKSKGSDAGHKGMRSVIECLGISDFSRMRIGIMGKNNICDKSGYVLGNFTKKEQKEIPDIVERAVSASECWVKEGIERAMNIYNARLIT